MQSFKYRQICVTANKPELYHEIKQKSLFKWHTWTFQCKLWTTIIITYQPLTHVAIHWCLETTHLKGMTFVWDCNSFFFLNRKEGKKFSNSQILAQWLSERFSNMEWSWFASFRTPINIINHWINVNNIFLACGALNLTIDPKKC